MSRDKEPVVGQWYVNAEEEETFRVITVDEDAEMVEIVPFVGEIEELDIDEWHELDLELTTEPEGWSEDEQEEEDDDEDEDEDDWDEDEDEDEDEDGDDGHDDGRER